MYSCYKERQSVVILKTTAFKGFKSAEKCRFDKRYDNLHQVNGCKTCTKEWDVAYLKATGLLKV